MFPIIQTAHGSTVNLKIISADRNHAASQNPVCTLQIYVIYKSENQFKLTAAASNRNKNSLSGL